jgi:hypothetical protein
LRVRVKGSPMAPEPQPSSLCRVGSPLMDQATCTWRTLVTIESEKSRQLVWSPPWLDQLKVPQMEPEPPQSFILLQTWPLIHRATSTSPTRTTTGYVKSVLPAWSPHWLDQLVDSPMQPAPPQSSLCLPTSPLTVRATCTSLNKVATRSAKLTSLAW